MKIQHLTKRYDGHTVLKDLNLTIREGKVYALMGPSGCGKTTLLHILMGILAFEEGTLEGFSGKKISAVFQENRLFDFLTAGENTAVVRPGKQNLEAINRILAEILPEESLEQKVCEYSGGMKRRAAIGRAMLAQSDMILMDEPLTGLDAATREQVAEFILKYQENRTLIFSTHQETEVELLHAEKIILTFSSES